MTFTSELPDPTSLPKGVWIALGVVAWYTFAAAVVRWTRAAALGYDFEPDPKMRAWVWAFSPVLLPVTAAVQGSEWFARWALTPRGGRGNP